MGDRGRPWWAVLVLAVPVALLLAGLWEAIALFTAVCAGLAGPVVARQWWSRRRQRAAHADGVQEWLGHVALDSVVGFWDVSVGSAFRFGAGVPVRLAPRPLGLLVEARRPGQGLLSTGPAAAPARAPMLVAWADIAGVRCNPRTRLTDWGRVGVLPFAVVELDLDGGSVLPFATLDPTGLAELITDRSGPGPDPGGPACG
ncbi:hypothetical protein OHA72_21595 [Dactylosporangium sp. NBC_01737]|uniref:hypothetical protein n=1 Tax=Dactylosporangium sp. NBC_01737 TaxID=2975959 RepID=UPI002E11CDAA|nr:hypothetical protein OHA72_21595 [Dactylosporangium sp. NBC_01737]